MTFLSHIHEEMRMPPVRLGLLELANPVMPASGTYGRELVPFVSPELLGAVVTKSITLHPNPGSPPPRLVETPSGLLSNIGLENQGIHDFLNDELRFWQSFSVPLIVNIAGKSEEEFLEICGILRDRPGVCALEINLSSLERDGIFPRKEFAPEKIHGLVKNIKKAASSPVIAKLSPSSDIESYAKACEEAGVDILSLVGGLPAVSFDRKGGYRLGGKWGRLSGPAIKPPALLLVEKARHAVSIPIIGMGGIFTAQDACEFFSAGAQAVAVGTATLVNPRAMLEIVGGLEKLFIEKKVEISALKRG